MNFSLETIKIYWTELKAADQICYLTQSLYTDIRPTSPSTDPIMPSTWQSSHKGTSGMTLPGEKTHNESRVRSQVCCSWHRHLTTWPPRFWTWRQKHFFLRQTSCSLDIEGSRPEWCISTIYHAWDTPLWSGTLDIAEWEYEDKNISSADKHFIVWILQNGTTISISLLCPFRKFHRLLTMSEATNGKV